MRGDALASGDRSASFPPPDTSKIKKAEQFGPKQVFCECRDCPRVFYSAQEFSEHIVTCKAAA